MRHCIRLCVLSVLTISVSFSLHAQRYGSYKVDFDGDVYYENDMRAVMRRVLFCIPVISLYFCIDTVKE